MWEVNAEWEAVDLEGGLQRGAECMHTRVYIHAAPAPFPLHMHAHINTYMQLQLPLLARSRRVLDVEGIA